MPFGATVHSTLRRLQQESLRLRSDRLHYLGPLDRQHLNSLGTRRQSTVAHLVHRRRNDVEEEKDRRQREPAWFLWYGLVNAQSTAGELGKR